MGIPATQRLLECCWLCGAEQSKKACTRASAVELALTHVLSVPNLLLYMLLILHSPVGPAPFQHSTMEMEHILGHAGMRKEHCSGRAARAVLVARWHGVVEPWTWLQKGLLGKHPYILMPRFPLTSLPVASLGKAANFRMKPWIHNQPQPLEGIKSPMGQEQMVELSPDVKHSTKQPGKCNVRYCEYWDCWWLPPVNRVLCISVYVNSCCLLHQSVLAWSCAS